MNKKNLLVFIPLLAAGNLIAQTALDNASNYTAWTDGSNEGSGFLQWSLNNNNDSSTVFAGHFLGDSTAGAGNINTGGQAFGMYANPASAFATAIRSFASSLSVNDQFSFKMGANFDNGNKGFNLRTAGDSIFNFNIGSGASVSSPNATLTAGAGAGYNYGGGDAMIDVVFQVITANEINYEISRSSSEGFQGVLFSGSVSGISGAIDNFEFYVSGTDGGDAANNLYFNSLQVGAVPEPSAFGFAFGCLALLWVTTRRR
jgi:hypothetical protein